MKIIIIYDNKSQIEGLTADWGFSCLIEHEGVNILFDTGANGAILLANMKALGIDPASINDVFISHAHFDHSGGLSEFLNANSNVRVYAPPQLRGIRIAREAVYIEKPLELRPYFHSTGLLDGLEQSLAIQTKKGLVAVVGCSHPGVDNILKAVRPYGTPYALVGGLHGFDDFDILSSLSFICPTHCTQHITKIKSLYPEKYIRGGAGAVMSL